ncbi:MAG: toll/interleukin-1 receptor domain-containing protein [Pseudomonadota bacterium]
MADIFLSYARADYETAVKVRDALEALDPDLDVFWDITGLDAGDVFPEKLETEVRDARVVLGLWNDNALGREWVKREVDIAYDNRTLLPVEIGPVTDRVISARLSTVHRTKLHDFDGAADHPGWQETVKSLAQRLKRPDLIRARKSQVKEEARAKKLEADLAKQRAQNEKLKKSKGGVRPLQWAVGGLVSVALAAGAGYYAIQWQAKQTRDRLIPPEVRAQLDDPETWSSHSKDAVTAILSRDDVVLVDLIQAAAVDADAAFLAGSAHDHGVGGARQEPKTAARFYEQACDGSQYRGCINLGLLYGQGLGVDRDYGRARELYEQGCDGGEARSCTSLGYLYYEGRGTEQDYGRAQELYEEGCDGGDANGCNNLGYLYFEGRGVDQDYGRARELYEQGCDGGEAVGCINLGFLYEQGQGVDQDYVRARELYEQGCDGGEARSCNSLGFLYQRGLGVDQDYVRARELYQQGCDGGNAKGCSYQGDLVYRGLGGSEDRAEGIRLLREGCGGDDQWGCNELAKYGE